MDDSIKNAVALVIKTGDALELEPAGRPRQRQAEANMSGFKYVQFLVELGQTKFLVPVIFPDKLVHSEVAAAMLKCLSRHFREAVIRTVSAGNINDLDVESVSGKSDTLGLKSDPNDAKVINGYLYTHGIVS